MQKHNSLAFTLARFGHRKCHRYDPIVLTWINAQMGRLFQVAVDPVSFDVRGVLTEPAMMPRFTEALVGKRFYVLFSMNFLACGQTWGDPPVGQRYLPVMRFDPDSLTYTINPPPNRVLGSNQVLASDVLAGRWGNVRYAQWSGSCLTEGADQGYIMTFMLTVAGRYNVWIYTDTENSRIVAGSPKVFCDAAHPPFFVLSIFFIFQAGVSKSHLTLLTRLEQLA